MHNGPEGGWTGLFLYWGYMDGMPRAFKIHSSLVNLKLKGWDWDPGRDKQDGGHSRGQFARLPRAF